jgi:hypothetical protein
MYYMGFLQFLLSKVRLIVNKTSYDFFLIDMSLHANKKLFYEFFNKKNQIFTSKYQK